MGRAEAGSLKSLNNKMKSKGLQRLRWYCQVCERQMRDENGFKCHTQSEPHFRQMELVAANPEVHIKKYSDQFVHDFTKQLRTAHGTKMMNINHFYQEYICDKEHTHMNATEWTSLTQFAMHLSKQGIATVEITEKGTMIGLIDNSPEALRRRETLKKKEAMAKGDEEREKLVVAEQVKLAQKVMNSKKKEDGDEREELSNELVREGDEKITLNFSIKKADPETLSKPTEDVEGKNGVSQNSSATALPIPVASVPKVKINPLAAKPKRKNPLSSSASGVTKKNPLNSGSKKTISFGTAPKMSEMERIMKHEMEGQKRRNDFTAEVLGPKRQRS